MRLRRSRCTPLQRGWPRLMSGPGPAVADSHRPWRGSCSNRSRGRHLCGGHGKTGRLSHAGTGHRSPAIEPEDWWPSPGWQGGQDFDAACREGPYQDTRRPGNCECRPAQQSTDQDAGHDRVVARVRPPPRRLRHPHGRSGWSHGWLGELPVRARARDARSRGTDDHRPLRKGRLQPGLPTLHRVAVRLPTARCPAMVPHPLRLPTSAPGTIAAPDA